VERRGLVGAAPGGATPTGTPEPDLDPDTDTDTDPDPDPDPDPDTDPDPDLDPKSESDTPALSPGGNSGYKYAPDSKFNTVWTEVLGAWEGEGGCEGKEGCEGEEGCGGKEGCRGEEGCEGDGVCDWRWALSLLYFSNSARWRSIKSDDCKSSPRLIDSWKGFATRPEQEELGPPPTGEVETEGDSVGGTCGAKKEVAGVVLLLVVVLVLAVLALVLAVLLRGPVWARRWRVSIWRWYSDACKRLRRWSCSYRSASVGRP